MAEQLQLPDSARKYVSSIDEKIKGKYDITLDQILADPDAYKNRSEIKPVINNMKEDIANYFDSLVNENNEDMIEFKDSLKEATDTYNKINNIIQAKSKELSIPYIEPIEIERDAQYEETIVIQDYDESMDQFLEKLLIKSDYVADISTIYEEYIIGAWFFSGVKMRLLTVNPPTSKILDIELSRGQINLILDYILS
jgi:archaellin